MKNSFEKHPAYEEEDLEIASEKELEEVKRLAGVTTHEEVMKRFEKEEKMEIKEIMDYHNPEDFQTYLENIEGLINDKKIHPDAGNFIDLFVLTNERHYFDEAVNFLKKEFEQNKYVSSGTIVNLLEKLADGGKPNFINQIMNFAGLNFKSKFDDYNRKDIAKHLLGQGLKEEAEKYLPDKYKNIEDFIKESWVSQKIYIEGLIKKRDFDEARKALEKPENSQVAELKRDIYLMDGKKIEDLKMVEIGDILNLINLKQVDIKIAADIVREKIGQIKEGHNDYYKAYYLSKLLISLGSREDIDSVQKLFDEHLVKLSQESKDKKYLTKTGKILCETFRYVTTENALLHLSEGLISTKLDPETEEKIISFLEKIDFEESDKEKRKLQEETLLELSKVVAPENKKIIDFILKKAQIVGVDTQDKVIFKLGKDHQKERILNRLKKEFFETKEKKPYEIRASENEIANKLLRFSAEYYFQKGMDKEIFSELQQMEKVSVLSLNRFFDSVAYHAKNLVEKNDYEGALKIFTNPDLTKNIGQWMDLETSSPLIKYLFSHHNLDQAEELIKLSGYKTKLMFIPELLAAMYKEGKKEEIKNKLDVYLNEQKDEKEKELLLFDSYAALMKLTK